MSYTKLFASIVHSTIWQEPDHVRLVWVTMLAMANRDGVIEASVPGLARAAGKSIEDTEDALRRFQEPDKYSRTPDHEGRRIECVQGGWRLLNHAAYRGKASREDAREKAAERKRRQRDSSYKERDTGTEKRDIEAEKRDTSRTVTPRPQCHDIAAPAPAPTPEAKADKGKIKSKGPAAARPAVDVPDWIDGDAWAGFAEMRKASRFPLTKRAAESIIAKLDDYRRQGQDPADVLDQSTRSGWRDVYPLKKDRVNGHGGETLEERIRRVSEDFAQGAPDA